ncbi:MAG: hypothetical protein ACR2QK_05330 [Acidimicrobiales bacterium]
MGFLDSVKSWFKAEAAEAEDLGRKTKSRLEADLDRREAALNATPEQRLEQIQEQISDGDAGFDDLQAKVEGRQALADADAELADIDKAARNEDVLDLESEEIIPPEPPPADGP